MMSLREKTNVKIELTDRISVFRAVQIVCRRVFERLAEVSDNNPKNEVSFCGRILETLSLI